VTESTTGAHRVVIVGAGFAGLAAAQELAGADVVVTLIDARNFHTFQPLLYEVATAGLEPADIAFPVRAMFGRALNVTFLRGRVERIDLAERRCVLVGGEEVPYDSLVVATGATASFFSIPGAQERSLPLYTLADARSLRNALLRLLEGAAASSGPARRALNLVVIGGGATGVEVAGAIVELLDISVRHDRVPIDRERTRVVLVDALDRLLSAFAERSSAYALRELTHRGIEVRLGVAVASVDAVGVHLVDGTTLPADLVVWAAGVTVAGTLAASLPGARGSGGRVLVGGDLALQDHPEVFVVGDAAAVPLGGAAQGVAPQLAQTAMQSGRYAARQVLARLPAGAAAARAAGASLGPFAYVDKGIMATIGRRAAVAELEGPWPLRGRILKGTLGWLSWLGLHLVYLVGVRNRLVVLLNWFWRYVGWRSGPRIIVDDETSA
jgi:NADH:ubiquinone reductase (H+-translocating)